jgi:peptide chain release factor 3
MVVQHPRTGKPIRLSNSQRLFARERETVDTAWPGDVVGIVGNQDFQIGDTLSEDPSVRFDEIPRFAPECFAHVHGPGAAGQKRFREGLDQLLREGVAQEFELRNSLARIPLLGAVGPLQFEVLQYRLETEYGAICRIEPSAWNIARWMRYRVDVQPGASLTLPGDTARATDSAGNEVLLFSSAWSLGYFEEKNRGIELSPIPFPPRADS